MDLLPKVKHVWYSWGWEEAISELPLGDSQQPVIWVPLNRQWRRPTNSEEKIMGICLSDFVVCNFWERNSCNLLSLFFNHQIYQHRLQCLGKILSFDTEASAGRTSLICMWMKSHFHMKGWAPRLALRKRLQVIRKWPIFQNNSPWNEEVF